MTKKKKPKPSDVNEEKTSWSNPNYEHATSEIQALRAILSRKRSFGKKMRENDESDKEEEHGNK